MRIRQLHLLRYGHFTDASISLPVPEATDLHLVFGENEAGKSTTKGAIEDLLFGIPQNSTRNFLHEYGAMRVGATLEQGDHVLKLRRRKGNKETLLSEREVPIPSGEGALAPYLAGADRRFYARMFSLDHAQLCQGGKEILEAQDDVGQMLFSASAGIRGLRESLKAMQAEADALWAPRRATHRRYFQAEDKLKAAEASLRDHLVTTAKWHLLKVALETANEAYLAIEQEIETKAAEQCKLSRIRRVCRDVRKRNEAQEAIRALGAITSFSEDASQILETSAKDAAEAAARIETLTEQIAALEQELAALAYDHVLLLRADDVAQLHERRIQIRAGKTDLPKRRAELAAAEAQLIRLAAELDWEADGVDKLIARSPARSKVASARTLLNQRGQLRAAMDMAKATVDEGADKLSELTAQINDLGPETDITKLSAVLKSVGEMGDMAAGIVKAEREAADARSAIDRNLKALRPAISDREDLSAMPVPPRDSIQSHRDACRALDQRMQTCHERIRAADQDIARHRKALARITADERVIAPDELERLRARRDAGWWIIRRHYMDGTPVPEDQVLAFSPPESLPNAFETAMRDADEAADQRFEKSGAAAQLVVIARQIDEQNDLRDSLRAEEKALAAERDELAAAWQALWAAVPVAPESPDVMIEWLRVRTNIVDLMPQLAAAERQIATLRRQESDAKCLLQAELEALDISTASLSAQPLNVLIQSAAAVRGGYEITAKTRRDLDAGLRRATGDAGRKLKNLEKAQAEWADWTTRWSAALAALQLPATLSAEMADAQLNAIDDMRVVAGRINELQHERIDKIERDIRAFEQDVEALVQAIAPQLAQTDAEDAVLDIGRLVAEATKVRDQAADKETALVGLRGKISECEASCRDARDVICRLQQVAAVVTIDEVRIAIQLSDRLRGLQAEFNRLTNLLIQDGDGLPITALNEECAATDLDEIAAREQTLTQELQDLRDRLMEARENRTNARREFDAIGGDDRAARDAADKQAALAETKEIAERYVRLRSAVLLLQWAIDCYRREKQAPILKRAGELFSILTGGSFETLQIEFGQDDAVQLAGMRQNGEQVGIGGMSAGTADQLYLALRVAAIEDYLDHASPLPFIADDLFINFDNRRAAAGFRVLNELAKKTQVLFFTHHQHLLEIARTTLGPMVPTVVLPAVVGRAEAYSAQPEAA